MTPATPPVTSTRYSSLPGISGDGIMMLDGTDAQNSEAPFKFANAGTRMLRHSDATGAVRKLLALAYKDRERAKDEGIEYVVLIKSKQVAAYLAVLDALGELPVFLNTSPTAEHRGN